MNAGVNHIISKFGWDTRFDKKEDAGQLQQRLSSWSRNVMPGEIANIFDKLCPPEQTWKLQSLEIDLGIVDYDNLEAELAKKLPELLSAKLTEYILRANLSDSNFEILDRSALPLQISRSFLLHGVMPWNYKQADGTVNQMLAYQLQNNLTAVIAMILDVGVTHENVRRRMAWQINEANIVKIIESLEPLNDLQIVDFANQMVKIQAKETIVQASTTDLKKNIWFWVFNYLFADRGTIFNRIAFMKSSIQQMAVHYHINYDELLGLIERAVAELTKTAGINVNFIADLKLLTGEHKPAKTKWVTGGENGADLWPVLEARFRNYSHPYSGFTKAEFNELVIGLSQADKTRFGKLLASVDYDEKAWGVIIKDLNDAALDGVMAAISPARWSTVSNYLALFNRLGKQTSLNINRDMLRRSGIKFLYQYRSSFFTGQQFLEHCIDDVSKVNGGDIAGVLYRLMNVNIQSQDKTVLALGMYDNLKAAFIARVKDDESSKKGIGFLQAHFNELIDALANQLSGRVTDKGLFVSLQKNLIKGIELYPQEAMDALMGYPDKEKLGKILPYIADGHTVTLLLKTIKKESYLLLLFIKQVISQLKVSEELVARALLDNLEITALSAILLHPSANATVLLQIMMDELAAFAPAAAYAKFERLAYDALSDKKLNVANIPASAADGLHTRYISNSKLLVLQKITGFIDDSTGKQADLCKLLLSNFDDSGFVNLRHVDKPAAAKLMNYLLRGNERLMHSLVKQYLAMAGSAATQASATSIHITDIYWMCLLSYSYHYGNAALLKEYFEAVMLFQYPQWFKAAAGKTYTGIRLIGPQKHYLANGAKIGEKQALLLINAALDTGNDTATYRGQPVYLAELVKMMLEDDPAAINQALTSTSERKAVNLLKKTIAIGEFSLLAAHGVRGSASEAILNIGAFYNLLSEFAPARALNQIADACWAQLWQLVTNHAADRFNLDKLIVQAFLWIAQEAPVNAETMMLGINRSGLRLSEALTGAIGKHVPAFSGLYVGPMATVVDKKLLQLQRAGLLSNLSLHLLTQNNIPRWYGNAGSGETKNLLNQIIVHYPAAILKTLKQVVITGQQMQWLHQSVNFTELIHSVGNMNKARQSTLNITAQFYKALGNMGMAGITGKQLQFILFRKVMKAWTSNSWDTISAELIWNELIWDVCTKHGISRQHFIAEIEKHRYILPPALQIALAQLKDDKAIPAKSDTSKINEKLKAEAKNIQKYPAAKLHKSIPVKNAGCVLINAYFKLLFERLGLIAEGEFLNEEAQLNAVHYLQYVVTGLSHTEEADLPLNKVLCGLQLSQPVADGITISPAQNELIEGLINAVIDYWPAIGNCSVEGFRGNWLVRDGLLAEYEDKWELTVEKRAYDLLISKSPFSFSLIKYPWMGKPLYVNWPY